MPRLPRTLRLVLLGGVTLAVLGAIAVAILVMSLSSRLPDVQTLRTTELQEPMYVYARDGRLMGLFGEMRRYPVDIKDVPARVKQAFLAAEDARFYQHHGVDYKGVARAIWLLATTNDKRVPGGSTITQQVARQYFLDSEYSYTRKLREMLLAMKMERELGKDEILGLYLNKSFFGNRAYGVAAAAEFYYGKKLDQLTLDEAATLAGTPKFPSTVNLAFLLRWWARDREGRADALAMVRGQLDAMQAGGIHDHLGGGDAELSAQCCWPARNRYIHGEFYCRSDRPDGCTGRREPTGGLGRPQVGCLCLRSRPRLCASCDGDGRFGS